MICKSIFSSPLGYLEICADGGDAVTRIYFTSTPSDTFTPNTCTEQAATQIAAYFRGERQTFTFPMAPEGTAFEQTVWQACREIPYGETVNGKALAAAIGDEKAVRKVLLAVDKNPIAIAIPTHRVKAKGGFFAAVSADSAVQDALCGAEKNFLKMSPATDDDKG